MAHALAQWQHPVASSEARDVLHQAMQPPLHSHIPTVIKTAIQVGVFFCIVNFDIILNLKGKDHVLVHSN